MQSRLINRKTWERDDYEDTVFYYCQALNNSPPVPFRTKEDAENWMTKYISLHDIDAKLMWCGNMLTLRSQDEIHE